MFRSGKRRPEEEDPLVPHGMVWYGTPETPPEPNDESLEATVRYAELMEMMRRRARAPAQQSREENGPQPEPARPAPIPWWRIPHPDPETEAAASSSPTAAVTPSKKPALPLKIEPLTAPPPTTVSSNSLATSEVKRETEEIEVKHEAEEIEQVKEVKELKTNEIREEEPARPRARAWTGSAAVINFTRSSLNFTRTSIAHSRRLAAHGRRVFSRAAAKAIRERAAPRWNPPRLRIVLTGLPLRITILLTRQLSEWKMRNPNATSNTRLRTAMIMAAACAVLGLFGVSLAPRFAARFRPSHTLSSGSTVGGKTVGPSAPASAPAIAQPSRSSVASGTQSPDNPKSASTPAAAKSEGEKPSPKAHRKHHHTDDDDYVAPNTYKDYGQHPSR